MAERTMQWFILAQLLLLVILQVRAKVPTVIVFGDSSVDSGNNNQISTVLKSNFSPYGRDFQGGKATGRFSNGRVPTDFISEAFGCAPLVPAYLDPTYSMKDFANAVCFASAGTGYDTATSDTLSVIPMWKELQYYKDYQKKLRAFLGVPRANEILSEALYLLSLGTNDFMENYYSPSSRASGRQAQFTIEKFQDFILGLAGKFVKDLYGLGARKISIGGLPPMGCLPLERARNQFSGSGCVEEYNKVAKDYNWKLQGLVVRLNSELIGVKVVLSNPYDTLLDIIQNPSHYGFESVAVACCGTGMFEMGFMCNRFDPFTCTDANKYVFWDSFHPTEKTNRIVADRVMKDVLSVFL
ncbi:hypothetical protein GIB67_026906 [Kingdonia uniflora]|uniref:GDSL esterase/lipase n=1 Tax=Kingdonia uniflora TaxID=39325 RepID=A0A7J7P1B0_9MAGN|nr:hypothetical protein GIB67_026906 [Kingdonia uniflora]